MKKLSWIALLAGTISCTTKNTGRVFDVDGTVKNAAAKMIYLEEDVAGGQATIMDSTTVKSDGSFHLQAPVKEESLFELRLKDRPGPLAFVINDAAKATIQADASATQSYAVKGSPATEALIDFDKNTADETSKILAQANRIDSLKQAKATDSLVNTEYLKLETAVANASANAKQIFKESKSPVLVVYGISSYMNAMNNIGLKGFSKAEILDILNETAARFPTHAGVQTIKKSFAPSKAPEFSQPDAAGNPVSLSSFKGKYVLLDFWASWCGPCRRDNPNVVKAYNEFKDKNFTVFGVSLDQNKDAWQKAIQQDGLAWTQVSDLKFWNNDAAVLYGVQAIPANFLIDPQGNIIAQDLHGDEIAETLRRVIK